MSGRVTIEQRFFGSMTKFMAQNTAMLSGCFYTGAAGLAGEGKMVAAFIILCVAFGLSMTSAYYFAKLTDIRS